MYFFCLFLVGLAHLADYLSSIWGLDHGAIEKSHFVHIVGLWQSKVLWMVVTAILFAGVGQQEMVLMTASVVTVLVLITFWNLLVVLHADKS